MPGNAATPRAAQNVDTGSDVPDALVVLKATLERNPDREAAWLDYANGLAAHGLVGTALALMDAAWRKGFNGPAIQSLTRKFRERLEAIQIHAQAIRYHQAGRMDQAIALYRRALAMQPNFTEAEVNLGAALQETGAYAQAIVHLRQAIAQCPDFAVAHYNLGNALSAAGQDPRTAYREAVALKPDYADAWYNLAMAQDAAGDSREAQACYRNAIAAAPSFAAAHMNLGVLLFNDGLHEEALSAYDRALEASPRLAAAHSNRGNTLRALGRIDAAARDYRAAIACEPNLAEAHNHLGNLLRDAGQLEQAAACYRAAIAVAPGFAEPFYNLGYILIEVADFAEGFAALTRYAVQTCSAQPEATLEHKRQHDNEQRQHLGPGAPDPLGPLHLAGGAAVAGEAISHHNGIEEQWRGDNPVVVIDDFLTQDALAGLRRFCTDSTIWREVYDGGYLGAFPEHGIACPLLAQIARELPARYPRIFANHPLLQLWAFKYGERITGVPLHADFAAVNVNFWIVPDAANLDPAHGGLVIWDKPAPLDWDFAKYNVDTDAGRRFLKSQNAKSLTIPYRANRAVIFDSDLFHETDDIHFAPGYGNRRINLTLLYGRRG
jgi:tetratricopeptide (TPR) repeat protein